MSERSGPFDAAADRRFRSLCRQRTPASALLDGWRAATVGGGWVRPEDWWVPAVDALARAVVQRRDARGPCTGLGQDRARCGLGIRATIEDLFALYRQVLAGGPPTRAVRSVVQAWAEASLAPVTFTLCGHPLRGATEQHLRPLLGGLYQLGGDTGPPVSEDFVVLFVDVADPRAGFGWEPMIRLLELDTGRLVSILPAHALLLALSPGRLGTLVRRTDDLPQMIAGLAATMADHDVGDGSRILTAEVPADLPGAYRLLGRVTQLGST